VLSIGFATSAHQAWSANIFTTVSDMFPKKAVASVIGIGGMAGGLGGMLISTLAGKLFDHYKALGHLETGYYIMFLICGFGYLLAWGIMHLLVPRYKLIELSSPKCADGTCGLIWRFTVFKVLRFTVQKCPRRYH
jgi:ACS family hexuronate transporter-like MFS transporter